MNRLHLSASIVLTAMFATVATAQTPPESTGGGGLKPTPYWIGVRCAELDNADPSIQIINVVPDAPAAKAGLRIGDQIVAINGEKLNTVQDLARLIQDSQGHEVRLTVRRENREFEAKMSPTRRRAITYTWPELRAHDLAEWIQRQAEDGLNSGVDMTLINPGVVLESPGPRFPANTRFTLERKAEGPVKLTIHRGDDQWTATSEDLEAIPEDLRPWAKRLLNTVDSRAPLIPQLTPNVHLLLPAPMQPFRSARPSENPEPQDKNLNVDRSELHKRLEELSRQMDALRQAIEAK